ncbi:hypothetical protein ABZ608_36755 [Streptomyces sp. NPDC013172]|uniref:hypothetical protein n=1 Tax=Streptomyces sp. NPDC013172 TaxID=3155009 RepID=UPI0033F9E359
MNDSRSLTDASSDRNPQTASERGEDLVSPIMSDVGTKRWGSSETENHRTSLAQVEHASHDLSQAERLDTVIQRTGLTLEKAWRSENYNDYRFPELATSALQKMQEEGAFLFDSIATWLIGLRKNVSEGPNEGGTFGQPPVTLYSDTSARFVIEALVWLDGTTAIHDHAFSGAFLVAQGSSVHTEYEFEMKEEIGTDMRLGSLAWKTSEILTPGMARPIHAGEGFIHALFHLDYPSITLVARTTTSVTRQYNYMYPGISSRAFLEPTRIKTQIRMLKALLLANPQHFQSLAESLLSDADLWTVRDFFATFYEKRDSVPDWDRIVAAAAEGQDETHISAIIQSAGEARKIAEVVALRRKVRKKDLRFFLALLMNVPDRSDIVRMTAERYPDSDPSEKIVSWISELSDKYDIGLTFTPVTLALASAALDDMDLQSALDTLNKQFPTAQLMTHRGALSDAWDELHSITLFRSLFGSPVKGVASRR